MANEIHSDFQNELQLELTSHPLPLDRVCVVYRVRPCPLYRVISWLSKHIHSIQVLGEHPCEIHSLFIHLLSSASPFLTALSRPVFKRPPPSWKCFSSLHSSLVAPLPRSTSLNWRRGRTRECFCLSLIFEIATKLGTNP